MKFILLAAAAVIAMPAIAQTSGSTGTSSPMSNSGQVPATQSGAPATDPAAPPPATMPAPMPQAPMQPDPSTTTSPAAPPAAPMSAPMPAQTTGGDPVGGYQPSAPALSGPVTPGATVVFQAAQSPDQAYPAPAPLAKYPVCKKGQYDKCIQRGGR